MAACSNAVKSSPPPIWLEGEICFSGIDGWFEISVFPVHLEGELYGYGHTIKDIDAHKIAEANEHSASNILLVEGLDTRIIRAVG